jgi:hypothetical protein
LILDIRSFRKVDCDTDHYLVVAKHRERLSVSELAMQMFDTHRLYLKKLNNAATVSGQNLKQAFSPGKFG